MNSLQDLMKRLSSIGQVTEAEEKCSECGCTPCECDDKDKVDEAKKPDADKDGIPDWADKDEEKVDEGALDTLKKFGKKALDTLGHPDDEEMIKDLQRKVGVPQTGKKPGEEEKSMKESALNLLRRYAGIAENNNEATVDEALNTSKLADTMGVDVQQLRMAVSRASTGKQTRSDIMLLSDTFVKLLNNPDDTVIQTVANLIKSGNTAPAPEANMKQEGNEFSGALKAAKDAGEEEFEVGGKKYKVNECNDMSPLTSVPNGESHMGIPAEIMARMSSPEMTEPKGPHMEVPMAAEEPNATYTLSIQNGENNLSMTTDMPDEIIHIMKLAGVNKGAEVTKTAAAGEQEVEESGYENTPDNTRARDPQAHGDIRDWGQKGTGAGKPNYPGTGASGDNPMNEQRMFQDYKNFKAGK